VGKIVVVGLLCAIGVWLLVDALITTDAERVEAEVERLLDVARKGGDAAAIEIRAAIADDYRGSGYYSRERIEEYIRRYVAGEVPEELWTGDYVAVPKGDEIVIPILRLHVRTKRIEGDTILRVTFAKRGDRFRIVSVDSWSSER